MSDIHKHDIGTVFRLTYKDQDGAVVPINGVTTQQIIFKKPNGALLTKTADFYTDGTDGKSQYRTVDGDLDATGEWKLQGKIVTAAGYSWRTDLQDFTVKTAL